MRLAPSLVNGTPAQAAEALAVRMGELRHEKQAVEGWQDFARRQFGTARDAVSGALPGRAAIGQALTQDSPGLRALLGGGVGAAAGLGSSLYRDHNREEGEEPNHLRSAVTGGLAGAVLGGASSSFTPSWSSAADPEARTKALAKAFAKAHPEHIEAVDAAKAQMAPNLIDRTLKGAWNTITGQNDTGPEPPIEPGHSLPEWVHPGVAIPVAAGIDASRSLMAPSTTWKPFGDRGPQLRSRYVNLADSNNIEDLRKGLFTAMGDTKKFPYGDVDLIKQLHGDTTALQQRRGPTPAPYIRYATGPPGAPPAWQPVSAQLPTEALRMAKEMGAKERLQVLAGKDKPVHLMQTMFGRQYDPRTFGARLGSWGKRGVMYGGLAGLEYLSGRYRDQHSGANALADEIAKREAWIQQHGQAPAP